MVNGRAPSAAAGVVLDRLLGEPPPAVHPTRVPEKLAAPGIDGTIWVPLNIE